MSEQEQERLIGWALQCYRKHPEWDDILQNARVAAWKAKPPPGQESTYIVNAARWAALLVARQYRHRFQEASLDFLMMGLDWDDGEEPWDIEVPVMHDPWPQVEDRLMAGDIWRWLSPRLTERERQVLSLWLGQGYTHGEIAGRLGLSLSRVAQLATAGLNRYRRYAGLPQAPGRVGGISAAAGAKKPARRGREANRDYMRAYRQRQRGGASC